MLETISRDAFEFRTFADRASWLEGRRTLGIGSSDAAAILGVSRFKSALALYYEKLGLTAPRPEGEEAREWGLLLEEPIAQRYSATVGRFVVKPPAHSVAVSSVYPWAIASVDRFINGVREGGTKPPRPELGAIAALEVKNLHYFMADEWSAENNNEPPIEVQVQLQHQLMVTGLPWGSIAALIGGNRFVWADRERDESLIAALAEREREFWRRLELRDPPKADGSDSSREILKLIYPKDRGDTIALPTESIEWHAQLEAAKMAEKLASVDRARIENLLRQAIGDASMGQVPGGPAYTFKLQERKEFVTKASAFRVLRLNRARDYARMELDDK